MPGAHRVGGSLSVPLLPHHRAYGSVHGGSRRARLEVLNARRPVSAQPCLAGSARYLRLGPSCEVSAQGGRKWGPTSVDTFSPSPVGPATTASADSCRPIPTSLDTGSTPEPGAGRQASQGKTRDLRAIYPSHIRPHPPGDIGLRACWLPRPDADASYALPVRQAGTLLTASFRPRLAATPLLFG